MNRTNMSFALGIILCLTCTFFPSRPLDAARNTEDVLHITCHPDVIDVTDLDFRWVGNEAIPVLPECEYITEPGKPMLPFVTVRVAVPSGYELTRAEVVPLDEIDLPGSYDIFPSQKPLPLRETAEDPPVTPKDPAVYGSTDPFPTVRVAARSSGNRSGFQVAEVLLSPLTYIPARRTLSLLSWYDLDFTLTREGSPAARPLVRSEIADRRMRDVIRMTVVNPEDVPVGAAAILTADYLTTGVVEELIITSPSYVSIFQDLADWKTLRGIPSEVITTDEIYGSYDGRDDQERIRNCITDYYQNNGLVWVLLGGDSGIVPYRDGYVPIGGLSESEKNVPSDLYYSDLDGDWNADGDSKWGEYPDDDVDLYSDVYVARAPVNTTSEARNFVDKILTYEASGRAEPLPLDYQLEMCFVGEQMWSGHFGGDAKDLIDDRYVPARFDPIMKLYSRDGTLSKSALRNALNDGQSIVNNDTHGWTAGMSIGGSSWTNSDMDALTNGARLGIWYSTSCYVGNFPSDCVGEHWVNAASGGGFAFIGNSHYGWGIAGSPGYGPSDKFDNQFFKSLLVNGYVNAGKAHGEAKNSKVVLSHGDIYARYCLYELNLLGDPETQIWTDTPTEVSVSHPSMILPRETNVSVLVTDDGGSVHGALVCLSKGDEVYGVGTTNWSGEATIQVHPVTAGEITVTVTASNHLPHTSTISVGMGDGRGHAVADH